MAPVEVFAEPTPNPNSMKFTLDRRVAEKGQSFNSPGEADQSPLARRLFEIRGVRGVFLLNNFISVSRDPAADWGGLVPEVEAAIRAHFA